MDLQTQITCRGSNDAEDSAQFLSNIDDIVVPTATLRPPTMAAPTSNFPDEQSPRPNNNDSNSHCVDCRGNDMLRTCHSNKMHF